MKKKSSKTAKSPEPIVNKEVNHKDVSFNADAPVPATLQVNNSGTQSLVVTVFARDGEIGVPELKPLAVIPLASGQTLSFGAPNVIKITILCPSQVAAPRYSYSVTFTRPRTIVDKSFIIETNHDASITANVNNNYRPGHGLKVKVSTKDEAGKRFTTHVDEGVHGFIYKRGVSASVAVTGTGTPNDSPNCSVTLAG
jgi:hypothetical protein